MPHDFSLSSATLATGRQAYYAQRIGSIEPKFLVGYKTMYDDGFGLFNTVSSSIRFSPDLYENQYGFWAYFIAPTAKAESQNLYHCLNTYDRAKFTFGFMQYASHVENGDFIKFFKKLLKLPNARDYFPKLVLDSGRIHYQHTSGTLKLLENDLSTEGLMNYLNPSLNEIEVQEQICSARLVHWALHDENHRKIQVETAIEHYRQNMLEYHRRFNLDGVPASVCAMICDIRHQGRAKNERIAAALATNQDYDKAFTNLCTIGAANYASRINTVRTMIKNLLNTGRYGRKYDAATNSFVPL